MILNKQIYNYIWKYHKLTIMEISEIILKSSYIAIIIITSIIRTPHTKKNKENRIDINKKGKQEQFLLILVMIGMMPIPLLYIFSPFLDFANYELPLYIEILGGLIALLGIWLFYRSHKDLGRNWSVTLEIREGHNIVDKGVYKHIRHPMYTAIWLWAIAQAIFLQNYIAGLSGIFCFGLLYFLRINKEEKMMLEIFGDDYQAYKKRTKRLVPFIL